jgi:hypothetical protein
MEIKTANIADMAGAGQKLLDHSRSAEFTARRGLVVEMYPFIFGAAQRMSSPAISQFLASELGIKLSSVTINKALKDPHKTWNLYFDDIEPAARTFAKDNGDRLREMLFKKQIFLEPAKNPILKAVVKAFVKDEVAHAISILRTKWYSIDLEVRLKARPYLEHRLNDK